MYTASFIIRESFRNWLRAASRMFQKNVSLTDMLLIPFGLIFAQPLATFSALFDFKLFRLNRFLNRLQAAMNSPVVLPTNEAERKSTLRWIVNNFFPSDLIRVGLGTSRKFNEWYNEIYSRDNVQLVVALHDIDVPYPDEDEDEDEDYV